MLAAATEVAAARQKLLQCLRFELVAHEAMAACAHKHFEHNCKELRAAATNTVDKSFQAAAAEVLRGDAQTRTFTLAKPSDRVDSVPLTAPTPATAVVGGTAAPSIVGDDDGEGPARPARKASDRPDRYAEDDEEDDEDEDDESLVDFLPYIASGAGLLSFAALGSAERGRNLLNKGAQTLRALGNVLGAPAEANDALDILNAQFHSQFPTVLAAAHSVAKLCEGVAASTSVLERTLNPNAQGPSERKSCNDWLPILQQSSQTLANVRTDLVQFWQAQPAPASAHADTSSFGKLVADTLQLAKDAPKDIQTLTAQTLAERAKLEVLQREAATHASEIAQLKVACEQALQGQRTTFDTESAAMRQEFAEASRQQDVAHASQIAQLQADRDDALHSQNIALETGFTAREAQLQTNYEALLQKAATEHANDKARWQAERVAAGSVGSQTQANLQQEIERLQLAAQTHAAELQAAVAKARQLRRKSAESDGAIASLRAQCQRELEAMQAKHADLERQLQTAQTLSLDSRRAALESAEIAAQAVGSNEQRAELARGRAQAAARMKAAAQNASHRKALEEQFSQCRQQLAQAQRELEETNEHQIALQRAFVGAGSAMTLEATLDAIRAAAGAQLHQDLAQESVVAIVQQLAAALQESDGKVQQLNAETASRRQEDESERAEREQALAQEQSQHREAVATQAAQLAKLVRETKQLRKENATLTANKKALEARVTEAASAQNAIEANLAETATARDALTIQLRSLTETHAQNQQQLAVRDQDMETLRGQLGEAQSQLGTLQAELEVARSHNAACEASRAELTQEVQAAREQHAQCLETNANEKAQSKEQAEAKRTEWSSAWDAAMAQSEASHAVALDALRQQLEQAEQERLEATAKIAELQQLNYEQHEVLAPFNQRLEGARAAVEEAENAAQRLRQEHLAFQLAVLQQLRSVPPNQAWFDRLETFELANLNGEIVHEITNAALDVVLTWRNWVSEHWSMWPGGQRWADATIATLDALFASTRALYEHQQTAYNDEEKGRVRCEEANERLREQGCAACNSNLSEWLTRHHPDQWQKFLRTKPHTRAWA